ncbi:TFIIB-type zinc finger domain-containing protein [Maritalea mobilis]|uniref:TFIIB-type zinc finger domain-containing protein n=1 Tax=Maritalea mobilis TaxID=483324 RepID=UPI001C98A8EC|nr:TFIIB-type zinc finger domain-containing protein [Maritalea mobilis]MBY6200738.1 TFIIB-type zinc finger domain-containing protein [Maritalea mobilis]
MPDTFDADPEARRPEDEHRFPCPSCGSDMRYAPADGKLICDHCGHEEGIEAGELDGTGEAHVEFDFEQARRRDHPEIEMEETRVSQCPSCGAQVEFDPNVHSQECPFCATPVVTDTGTHRHIKPQGVLPFGVTEREAHKAMNDWLGKLWFAPNGLKEYARNGRKLDGIYVPYWTYDADTQTAYRGQRGDAYYVTVRGPDGKPRQQRRMRWTFVRGRVARFFDDVLVLASRSLPKSYTDGLAPWDLTKLADYKPEFLSGFRAEAYQIDLEDGMVEARAIMDNQIRRDIRRDIGGDAQRISKMDVNVSAVTFKHVLLPVWLAAYKYRGKSYRFVVNGQTGKVQGERPYSWIKIALAILAAIIIAGGVLYGLEVLDNGGFSQSGSLPAPSHTTGFTPPQPVQTPTFTPPTK